MTDIFDEISEDIRRDRLKKLWERWSVLIIAAAVVIVVGVAGWRGWQWYQQKENAEAGSRFEAALALARTDKSADALKALDAMAGQVPAGYALLARFRAATESAGTDSKGAVAALDAIAADGKVPGRIRDLAKLRAAMVLLDVKDRSGVTARLQGLAAAGGPWRNSAREILALAAWQAGDVAATEKLAQEMVADAQSPPGVRQRATMLLDLAASARAGHAPQPKAAPAAAAPAVRPSPPAGVTAPPAAVTAPSATPAPPPAAVDGAADRPPAAAPPASAGPDLPAVDLPSAPQTYSPAPANPPAASPPSP